MPSLGPNVSTNLADSAAMQTSASRASPTPPPAATPLIAVTVGTDSVWKSSIMGFQRCSMPCAAPSPAVRLVGSPSCPPPARSAPLEKPRPSPVSTSARMEGSSLTIWRARRVSRMSGVLKALSTSCRHSTPCLSESAPCVLPMRGVGWGGSGDGLGGGW